jgi:hypothetical protein
MTASHQGSGQQVGKSFYEKTGYRKIMQSGPIFCIAKPPVTSIRTTFGSTLGTSETLNPSSFSSGLSGACNQKQVLESQAEIEEKPSPILRSNSKMPSVIQLPKSIPILAHWTFPLHQF